MKIAIKQHFCHLIPEGDEGHMIAQMLGQEAAELAGCPVPDRRQNHRDAEKEQDNGNGAHAEGHLGRRCRGKRGGRFGLHRGN